MFTGFFPQNAYPALIKRAAIVGPVNGIFCLIIRKVLIPNTNAPLSNAAP